MSTFFPPAELLFEGEVCSLDNDSGKKAIKDRFTQIYDEYRSAIYKFCLVRLRGDSHAAEDCMQNTFIVLYKKMQSKEEIEYPRAFLYRTADNLILKCVSQKVREEKSTVPLDEYEDLAYEERQDEIDSDIDYSVLNRKITAILNEEEQMLFKLKYIDDLTIEQAAAAVSISQTAAAKRLQRIRDKIKNSIKVE